MAKEKGGGTVKLKRTGKSLSKKTPALEYFNGFHSIVRSSDSSIEVLKGMVGLAGGMMTIGRAVPQN